MQTSMFRECVFLRIRGVLRIHFPAYLFLPLARGSRLESGERASRKTGRTELQAYLEASYHSAARFTPCLLF